MFQEEDYDDRRTRFYSGLIDIAQHRSASLSLRLETG